MGEKGIFSGVELVGHAMDATIAAECNKGRDRAVDGVVWNVGTAHVICECPQCTEKRKQSICGCGKCEYHTEIARLGAGRFEGA